MADLLKNPFFSSALRHLMLGAALVATIVVSLTAAWGLGEVTGYKRSLANYPFEAPWFYGVYVASLLVGAGIVLSGINLVKLAVGVNVMNALLLPIILGFLYLCAPESCRLKGWYAVVLFCAAKLAAVTVLATKNSNPPIVFRKLSPARGCLNC